ncbi:hypothetical protein LB467_03340 [Salegentibacter sp. JZCK2]|nr:hypothetical protein [Salegentibacter tibetensis]MBZ9728710.1 hypothetical protein [Salegentibacter tibetensis]
MKRGISKPGKFHFELDSNMLWKLRDACEGIGKQNEYDTHSYRKRAKNE